jgi:hypothetical protein
MDYQYDIFISYRRVGSTRKWVNDIFLPMLNDIISLELGYEPTHYIDSLIEAGSSWPLSLAEAISTSKVIIPLWSVTYLDSVWCKSEISHMLAREVKTGFKTIDNNIGLVFPIIINDGENLPINISISQKIEIKEYYVPFMDLNSKSAEELYKILRPYGISIAKSIKKVPKWQSDWKIETMNEFYELFNDLMTPRQSQLPKFINL